MNITTYTKPKCLLTVAVGLLLLVDPNLLFSLLGMPLGTDGTLLGRLLGVAYIGLGQGFWFIRTCADLPRRDALVMCAADLLSAGLVIQALLSGAMGPLGWALVAVFVGSALGFGLYAKLPASKSVYA